MELEKSNIKRAVAHASTTYDSVAALQRRVGNELLQSLDATQLRGRVLDVGCGTGFLCQGILQRAQPECLIALDIALPMLHSTRGKLATAVLPLCADAEHLPLANRSIDSIVSNLAVQWCDNIGGVFAEFQRVLHADGSLVFSTFAPQTLHELKTAWASVDDAAHVNDFYSAAQLVDFLQVAGFQRIAVKNTLSVSHYDSVWALMQELKQLGAHNVLAGRKRGMTGKRALQNMIAAYPQHDGQISATFEMIQIVAR